MNDQVLKMANVRASMVAAGMDALCLSTGSDLPYLTGYRAMPLERLTMLVVTKDDAVLVVPALEAPRVDESSGAFDVRPWHETEDPVSIVDGVLGSLGNVALGDETWARFLIELVAAQPQRKWSSASGIMTAQRIVKSPEEIAALRNAARTVDSVVSQMAEAQFSGRSESDVARELVDRTISDGHESMEFWIVASGPNGASPHHEPGDRIIEHGDAVVVDFGGHQQDYASDTTRMFVVGEAPFGFDEAYEVLRSAQAAAVDHVRPGVTAESVDRVAREIIADAGYGDLFFHRTGHGIGMDTHEHPYLVEGNETVLEPGMAFSVEPGIYLEGEWGMRIEDIVVVTEDGVERLNRSDRSYRVVS